MWVCVCVYPRVGEGQPLNGTRPGKKASDCSLQKCASDWPALHARHSAVKEMVDIVQVWGIAAQMLTQMIPLVVERSNGIIIRLK